MTLDPQAAAILKEGEDAPLPWDQSVEQLRTGHEATAAFSGPGETVEVVEDLMLEGRVPARLYRPASDERPLVVYLHGGGWVVGSLYSYDPLCRALANSSGAAILSVAYRLAPEHPFPAGLEDAVTALRWGAERFGAGVAVAGDSAGGNLAVAAALTARVALRGLLLIYPVLDSAMDTPSYRELGEDYGLTRDTMAWYWKLYLDGHDPGDPRVAPLHAGQLGDLPPAMVLTAEYDPLRDEAEVFAERLRDAGVAVERHRYGGMVHGFYRWMGRVEAAREAVGRSGAWLTEVLAPL